MRPPRSILRTTKHTEQAQKRSPHLTQPIFFAQKTSNTIHYRALGSELTDPANVIYTKLTPLSSRKISKETVKFLIKIA